MLRKTGITQTHDEKDYSKITQTVSFGEELAVCLSPLEDANVLESAMSYVKLGDFPPVSTNDSLSDKTLQDPGVVSLRIRVVTQVPCCRLKMRLYIPLF